MDIKSLLKESNSWTEFKLKMDALPKKQMGNAFEMLTKLYFKINPVYSFYDEIWLLSEVPTSVFEYLGLPSHDLGIDLIAKHGEEYHPIQCKYHSEKNSSITFNEVSTFISLLEGNDKFTQGYICSTANVTSKNLDKVKNKPINLILSDSWVQLDEDFFSKIRNYFEDKKYTPTAYVPMEHQVKALKDSVDYFIAGNNSRGKLIFPCGAGKSLTGFWMTQELKSTSTLIAVPSLSLVKQTLDVYLREIVARGIKVKWLCICSDEGIGKDDEIMENTESLGIPCQTNPDYIEKWLETNRDEHKIIFTTYQSGRIIADVSKKLNISFDLGIFDEAHKTVGLNKKLFSYLLFDENISIAKRIFMTATERFYSGSKEDIISMDDYDIYGETFSQMSFKEAIEKELLTDYKIITIDVKKSEVAEFIKSNNLVQLNNKWKNETEARSLASMIALRKAMKVLPIKNAVSFHSSIDKAQRIKDLQSYITSSYNFEPIDSFTVSSKVATSKRNDIIKEFADSKRALITNAKCLTEGVDVPNIDCIVFADPRKSKVDIVQALGRALRKKKGKEWGYVILPVLYDDATHEIDNDNYNEIISIVRGLAANDERIIEYFKEKNDKPGVKRIEGSTVFDFNFTADLLDENELTKQLQIKIWESLSKFNWMDFEAAREYVWSLELNNVKEWNLYAKSKLKPLNIPSNPQLNYKNSWVSWGNFLGTGVIAMSKIDYLDFENAKKYVQTLGILSQNEWYESWEIKIKNNGIPKYPKGSYKNKGWKTWGDFLGTNKVAYKNINYQPYDKARVYIRELGLKNTNEWLVYCKSGNKPFDIPSNPQNTYKNKGWIDYGDWLGTYTIASKNRKYLDYKSARSFVHNLKFKSKKEWLKYCASGEMPMHIPSQPDRVYSKSNEWVNYSDWLGTELISDVIYLNFNEAKEFVHNLNLKKYREWRDYCISGNKPIKIPSNPQNTYKNKGWINMADWINIKDRSINRDYLKIDDLKDYIKKFNIKSYSEWKVFCNSNLHQSNIPKAPDQFYKEWISWGDFLGTGYEINRDFLPYVEAKAFVNSLKLKNQNEWKIYSKSGKKPKNIPGNPHKIYLKTGEWVGLGDWLGTGVIAASKMEFADFNTSKNYVINLKLNSVKEWTEYSKSGKRPSNIPSNPQNTYKNKGWKSWADFLGKESK